jgi:hypothetical protein
MCSANAAECADRAIKLTNSGRLNDWNPQHERDARAHVIF